MANEETGWRGLPKPHGMAHFARPVDKPRPVTARDRALPGAPGGELAPGTEVKTVHGVHAHPHPPKIKPSV